MIGPLLQAAQATAYMKAAHLWSSLPLAGPGSDPSASGGGSWVDTVIGWFKDPTSLLLAMGPWVLLGVAIIVLIESGVLFPVLPGDSLIFAAGLLHVQLGLNIWVLIGVILVAAFIGAQIGYWIGWKWGRRLFKDDARFLKTEYLHQAEKFFDKYGGRALVLGRFVPFVRTFVPLAAGIAKFPYGRFLLFNTLGALVWGGGITWAGAALGGVPFVHDNLEIIILLIVLVSVLPMVVEWLLARRRSKRTSLEGGAAKGGELAVETHVVDDGSLEETAAP